MKYSGNVVVNLKKMIEFLRFTYRYESNFGAVALYFI